MRQKEDLFELIHAMSRSEKRYFTLDAKKGGRKSSQYLQLFQAINRMEHYEEAPLQKKFKHLPQDKSYLYEAILRSMRDYRSIKSRTARLKERLQDVKYLSERGLYHQSEERLTQARELAEALGDHLSQLEIIKEERTLAKYQRKTSSLGPQQLARETTNSLQALRDEFNYLELSDQLLNLLNQKLERKSNLPSDAFDRSPLNQPIPSAPWAQLRYLQSVAIDHWLNDDQDAVVAANEAIGEWWNKHPIIKEEYFYLYVSDVGNLLSAYNRQKQYRSMAGKLAQLEKEKPVHAYEQAVLFLRVITAKILTYINIGIQEPMEALLEKTEVGLQKHPLKDKNKGVICFNLAILLFIYEAYETCLEWLMRIIGPRAGQHREDIIGGAQLLRLIAAYSTEDLDIFEKAYRAVSRYFSKSSKSDDSTFETQLIRKLRKSAMAPLDQIDTLEKELLDYLEQIYKDKTKHIPLGLDELFLRWMQARQENISLASKLHQ